MDNSKRILILTSVVAVLIAASIFFLGGAKKTDEKPDPKSTSVAATDSSTEDYIEPALVDVQVQDERAIIDASPTEVVEEENVSAIRALTDTEEILVQPALEAKFYKNGDPKGYRRHRLVHIDTETLRSQLESTSISRSNTAQNRFLSIPLFDDLSIDVGVDIWVSGGPGIRSAFGESSLAPGLPDAAAFTFDRNGRLEGSIRGRDFGYLVANVLDDAYYVVFELDYAERTD